MRYRTYTRFFLSLLFCFAVCNFVIWKNYTEILLTKKCDGGDLSRMGYVLGSKQCRKIVNDLPRRHIEMKEYDGREIDVMTIGDSLSGGGGEGRNSFYQDYIATINNCSVLNVYPYPTGDLISYYSPASTLAVLLNSGYLDIIKPRNIIIESVVRYCVPRYARPLPLDKTDTLENIRRFYDHVSYNFDYLPPVGFINNGNFKFVLNNILYRFSDNAFQGRIYRRKLSRSFFTAKDDDMLVFYREDLTMLPIINAQTVGIMNDNLNKLAEILAKKGIRLYFMPAVDKYDLYRDYIVDNTYPENPFFDELRKLPKRYTLIDTKAILLPELRKGEKDIYFADDSHWTCKASRKIFETVRIP